MAKSISSLNVGLDLDANKAIKGISNFGDFVDQLTRKVKSATAAGAAFGTFIGNLGFKAFTASVSGAVSMVESLANKLLEVRLAADKAKFGDMVAGGTDPKTVASSKEFNESALAGVSKLQMAWEGFIDTVTGVFGPAISGVFTAAADMLRVFAENFAKAFDPQNLSLQSLFENCYKITLQIASKIVEAGLELVRLVNSIKLLGNKSARGEAWDGILYDLGLIDRKERNKRLNARLKEGGKNGDLEAINAWADQDRVLGRFKEGALEGLKNLAQKPLQWDPLKVWEKAMGKPAEQIKDIDPKSIFGDSSEKGSAEDYNIRMQMRYGDLVGKQDVQDKQLQAMEKGNDLMENVVSLLERLNPFGIMEIGGA